MKHVLILLLALLPATGFSMKCTVSSDAEDCTITSRCRGKADLFADCGEKGSGYIRSDITTPLALLYKVQAGTGSASVNGKWVPGKNRDLKGFDLTVNGPPFTLEELYLKRPTVNEYLKETYNLPPLKNSPSLEVELPDSTKIYTDSSASLEIFSKKEDSSASPGTKGYMFCQWKGEPFRYQNKMLGSKPICKGEADCQGNGKFLRAPPPATFSVSCEGSASGCPSAFDCFKAPDPDTKNCRGRSCNQQTKEARPHSGMPQTREFRGIK